MGLLLEIFLLLAGLLLLQLLGDWFLRAFGEVVADVIQIGVGKAATPRWVATLWFLGAGLVFGVMSLLALPGHLISIPWLRVANVAVAPVAVAGLAAWFAAWFRREPAARFADVFYLSYCFALALMLVRFGWGR